MAALLACALAVAALMFAARAARRGRALGDELESLSTRVATLTRELEQVRGAGARAGEREPAAPGVQDGPEPGGPDTVH